MGSREHLWATKNTQIHLGFIRQRLFLGWSRLWEWQSTLSIKKGSYKCKLCAMLLPPAVRRCVLEGFGGPELFFWRICCIWYESAPKVGMQAGSHVTSYKEMFAIGAVWWPKLDYTLTFPASKWRVVLTSSQKTDSAPPHPPSTQTSEVGHYVFSNWRFDLHSPKPFTVVLENSTAVFSSSSFFLLNHSGTWTTRRPV